MKLIVRGLLLISSSVLITSCTIYGKANDTPYDARPANVSSNVSVSDVQSGGPLAGSLDNDMDANDRVRMSKALDGGLGKASHWTNPVNHISYTVTPIAKVNKSGTNICRSYSVKANNNGRVEEVRGTACVAIDGSWTVAG